ncbi:hypothetical protein QTJ16_000352 [Diplocarpon rosae]|uniref:Uncharacterized protein n=1 Tax=Diplocarpon rosae TaxID=946125 RepID=A0AAD9T5S1_9HELO|nr:hypothetical protein QTJ16_000352 [Diplocarpon rosae]
MFARYIITSSLAALLLNPSGVMAVDLGTLHCVGNSTCKTVECPTTLGPVFDYCNHYCHFAATLLVDCCRTQDISTSSDMYCTEANA